MIPEKVRFTYWLSPMLAEYPPIHWRTRAILCGKIPQSDSTMQPARVCRSYPKVDHYWRQKGIQRHRKQSRTLSSTSAICIWSKATGSWRTALRMSDPRRWNCQCASSSTRGPPSVCSPNSLRMSVRCLRHVSAKAVACIFIAIWAVVWEQQEWCTSKNKAVGQCPYLRLLHATID